MNDFVPLMIGVVVAILVAFVLWPDNGALREFTQRCEDKGGVTLSGYRNNQGWIGCYKVEEIENESKD